MNIEDTPTYRATGCGLGGIDDRERAPMPGHVTLRRLHADLERGTYFLGTSDYWFF